MQLKGIKRHNKKYSIQYKELTINDIVLLYNTKREKEIFHKHAFKWLGLYQIYNLVKNKGIYILEELYESQFVGIFADNRLEKFHL